MEQVLEVPGYCCRNSREKLQRGFRTIRMRNCLCKEQLQLKSTGTFCILFWGKIQMLSNFYYLLTFSLSLN